MKVKTVVKSFLVIGFVYLASQACSEFGGGGGFAGSGGGSKKSDAKLRESADERNANTVESADGEQDPGSVSEDPGALLLSRYKYLDARGKTMAQKEAACAEMGTGWAVANLSSPEEIVDMRTFLEKHATPAAGTSVYSLPNIANSCSSVNKLVYPAGLDPTVDCSGAYVMINWPGVNDSCEPQAKVKDGAKCIFKDDGNPSAWPVLCEHTKV